MKRYWHRRETRLACATPATDPEAVALRTHSEVAITRHSKVRDNRSPYDGDWVYWSTRRGWHPSVSPRLATLLKKRHGRCPPCGLYFHHDNCIEIDHINGDRRNARESNLQALHGHCYDAKTREQCEYLPRGKHDKPQDTEERREAKVSRAVLEQR